MKATWNGVTLAQSEDTLVVESNHYFPPGSLNQEFFLDSDTHTWCPWKGEASYKSIVVDGQVNRDGAWYYLEPKDADYSGRTAADFKGRFAFWHGVRVED